VDFWDKDRLAAHRPAAREWIAANVKPEWVEEARLRGHFHSDSLYAKLAAGGIFAAGWPPQYGGSDVDPQFAETVLDELALAGLRSLGWINTRMVVNIILRVGSEETKRAYVPAALRGECVVSLGFSEPGSGTDVAAARTRAVREGGKWRINGSKMFTSTARIATHVILLTRTNPEAAKHRGLTLFLVPLASDGVEIRPVHTLGYHPTNATFYTDVIVPDSARLGEVDGGWSVMKVALVFERTGETRKSGATLSRRVADWARNEILADGRSILDSPAVRQRLATMAIDDEVARLLFLQVNSVANAGGLPRVEGAIAKLFATERTQVTTADLLDLAGAAALVKGGETGAVVDGAIEREFRDAVVTTIYGGASEVLRDIIAEQRLGLPRTRPVK
jgi:alkylation response protein AidB-like acyl-CoA dehydrogenase